MSDTNKSKYFRGGVALCFALIGTAATLSDVGKKAERYSALQMEDSLLGLEDKYAFLYEHFGRPAHFYQSLSKALLKDDYSMLELLAINEKAVTADSQEDYASLQLPLLPPAIHLHHTDFEDHTALTAGGYPLTAIAISNNNQLVISFKNVSESTVIELEQQMDHNPSTQEGSETGRVTFKKGASGYQVKLKGLRTFS
ncbi:hypothetical protein [Paraglaciecola chathamensis]|jgi:hypothetical protein|uniref:Uncharacterized protein n=1 Tax=Paraglaciecola chathamensis TaxID=368405 RepID=A0A8H9M2R8_9ALTE|nr:hypothetical protein [Paraglaciecola oceanifecundans]GGZ78368.1 hypothetical protein GCM10011274_40660 [Paraglaciecola oceanifecundans]